MKNRSQGDEESDRCDDDDDDNADDDDDDDDGTEKYFIAVDDVLRRVESGVLSGIGQEVVGIEKLLEAIVCMHSPYSH